MHIVTIVMLTTKNTQFVCILLFLFDHALFAKSTSPSSQGPSPSQLSPQAPSKVRYLDQQLSQRPHHSDNRPDSVSDEHSLRTSEELLEQQHPYLSDGYIRDQIILASTLHTPEGYESALSLYSQVLRWTNNESTDALHLSGLIHHEFLHDSPHAISLLTSAIRSQTSLSQRHAPIDYPLLISIMMNRGEIYRSMGLFTKSLENNREALDIIHRQSAKGETFTLHDVQELSSRCLYNSAQSHLDEGKPVDALSLLIESLGPFDTTTTTENQDQDRDQGQQQQLDIKTVLDIGQIYFDLGQYASSLSWYSRIEPSVDISSPFFVPLTLGLGTSLHRLGRLDSAEEAYRAALNVDPNHPNAMLNLGAVYHERGEITEAISLYSSCLVAMDRLSESEQAQIDSFQRIMILNNLGAAYIAGDDGDEGRRILEDILSSRIFPPSPSDDVEIVDVLLNLGGYYMEEGLLDSGREIFDRALQAVKFANDGVEYTRRSLGLMIRSAIALPPVMTSLEVSRVSRAAFDLRVLDVASGLLDNLRSDDEEKITDVVGAVERVHFYLVYLAAAGGRDRQTQRLVNEMYQLACDDKELKTYAKHLVTPQAAGEIVTTTPSSNTPQRPLRIGFISKFFGDFEPHGLLLSGVIKYLPQTHFHKILLPISSPKSSPAPYLTKYADEVVPLPLNSLTVRSILSELSLDVLVFADMNSEPLTHFLSYSRFAPLQILFWGNPITSGQMDTIDYFISGDRMEDPVRTRAVPGRGDAYSEQVVHLSGQGIWYDSPAQLLNSNYPPETLERLASSATKKSPSDFGLPHLPPNATIYLCAQSVFKLHPAFDDVIFSILEEHDDSVVVFTKGRRKPWTESFRQRLLASDLSTPSLMSRIILIERVSSLDFPALIELSDVLLHPFPFGGSRTSADGLLKGKPVVTFPQRHLRGRMAVSFYATMNLWDCCVANDSVSYVEKAVRLGRDGKYRRRAEENIRERVGMIWDDERTVWEWTRFLIRAAMGTVEDWEGAEIREEDWLGSRGMASWPNHATEEYEEEVIRKMQKDDMPRSDWWDHDHLTSPHLQTTPNDFDNHDTLSSGEAGQNPSFTPYEHFLSLASRRSNDDGDLPKALSYLMKLIFERPNDPDVLSDLGAVRHQLWDLPGAEIDLRRALKIDAEHPNARNNLAVVLKDMGRTSEALDIWSPKLDDRSRKMASPNDVNIMNAATVLRDGGDIKGAFQMVCDHLFRHVEEEEDSEKEKGGVFSSDELRRHTWCALDLEGKREMSAVVALALLQPRPRHAAVIANDLKEQADLLREPPSPQPEGSSRGGGHGNTADLSDKRSRKHNRIGLLTSLSVYMDWLGLWDGNLVHDLYRLVGGLEHDDENPARSYQICAENAPEKNVRIMTQLHVYKETSRNRESKIALVTNLLNPCVERVYLFSEDQWDKRKSKSPLDGGEIPPNLLDQLESKLEVVPLGRRMTFADAFLFANNISAAEKSATDGVGEAGEGLFILSNDDIAFDHSLSYLVGGIGEGKVLALTRHELSRGPARWIPPPNDIDTALILARQPQPLSHQQGHPQFLLHPRADSQDSWAFRAPVPPGVIAKSDFFQGLPRCDGRMARIFEEEGLRVLNPAIAVRTMHLQNLLGEQEGGAGGNPEGKRGTEDAGVKGVKDGVGYDARQNVNGDTSFVLISDVFLFG